MLYAPSGTNISVAFKLEFSCTNNEAKYEALIIGLTTTLNMGILRLRVQGDLKLIIKQVNGEFELNEISLMYFRMVVQNLVKSFENIHFQHTSRAPNRMLTP